MSKNILQGRIKPAEYVRNVYGVTPEAGTTLEQMQRPEYWAHVARNLRAGDRLEITPEDKSWFAELFVRSQTDTTAEVHVMRQITFDKPKVAAPVANGDPYKVEHQAGSGWRVVRKSDKVVVFDKGQSRKEAEAWVEAQMEMA